MRSASLSVRDWCAVKREAPRAVLMALEPLSIKRKNQRGRRIASFNAANNNAILTAVRSNPPFVFVPVIGHASVVETNKLCRITLRTRPALT